MKNIKIMVISILRYIDIIYKSSGVARKFILVIIPISCYTKSNLFYIFFLKMTTTEYNKTSVNTE